MVEVDENYIDAEPIKYRTEDEMIRAYQVLLNLISETGVFTTKTHILDNEKSDEFKIVIEKSKLQLVQPDTHQKKYSIEGNADIQESSHCNFVEVRLKILNVLVVYITPTDSPYLEFGEAIPC